MESKPEPEYWLRGPLEEVPLLLNPVVAVFYQVISELEELLLDFPENKLWEKPLGMASVGFHLNHLTGVVDRLFTYARKESLSPEQMDFLRQEEIPQEISSQELLQKFRNQVKLALSQLKSCSEKELNQARAVGRLGLPTTLMGLYFHAAEHSSRHLGQLILTITLMKQESIRKY